MSLVSAIDEDDNNNNSSSSSANSDDDMDELNCDTHRSCSRHATCNRNNYQHSLIGSMFAICLSKNSKATKGDIRCVDNEPEHQQKYDGYKWRRVCSHPNCLKYLNGGIFHNSWLCRTHYLLNFSSNTSIAPGEVITQNIESTISTNKTSEQLCTRPSNKQTKYYKRGDIMIDMDGIRQKYNGRTWHPICNYTDCKSFIVAHGYCRRHDTETRKKRSEILSSLDDLPEENSISTSSISTIVEKPKKGDIQLVRQQWSGNKWYSLCNFHTQDCTRRSAGQKYANLCDVHYKEHLEKQTAQSNPSLTSPRVKRKKSLNQDNMNHIETQSTFHNEQSIQTDLTYPLESDDLHQGCIFIEDDSDDQYRCESPPLRIYIKKEEETYVNNKRKLSIDVNSLAMNCKLEITKLEY